MRSREPVVVPCAAKTFPEAGAYTIANVATDLLKVKDAVPLPSGYAIIPVLLAA